METILPKPHWLKYDELVSEINLGRMKIPVFQRGFVWSRVQTAKLLDSILRGYPIGTFIIWKTRERLRDMRNIGNVELREADPGDSIQYILDGQQRITSLFATISGAKVRRKSGVVDFREIVLNLDADEHNDEPLVYSKASNVPPGAATVSVFKLLSSSERKLYKKFKSEKHQDRIEAFKKTLQGYLFPTVELPNAPLKQAVEVFQRLNINGQKLEDVDIMVAKTFEPLKFDLAVKIKELVHGKRGIASVGFEIPHPYQPLLQCVSAVCSKAVSREAILTLPKEKFIAAWVEVESGVKDAVEYLRTNLQVPVIKLLPYPSLLVLLTYFFVRNKMKKPTPKQRDLLRQLFAWIAFGRRYQKAQGSRLTADLKRIDAILAARQPAYDSELRLSRSELIETPFKIVDGLVKGVLWVLASKRPLSFADGAPVVLDNAYLKQKNSKNYHHFFPRHFLKSIHVDDRRANSVVNIALVEDHLNKGKRIGSREPSDYVGEFKKTNLQLGHALTTHLIGDLRKFGIVTNNYERFLEQRAKMLVRVIKKWLGSELVAKSAANKSKVLKIAGAEEE